MLLRPQPFSTRLRVFNAVPLPSSLSEKGKIYYVRKLIKFKSVKRKKKNVRTVS